MSQKSDKEQDYGTQIQLEIQDDYIKYCKWIEKNKSKDQQDEEQTVIIIDIC